MALKNIPFGRLILYVLLSVLDLLLTWQLIQQGEGQVYEGNPIANWWLTRTGWLGLSAFKLATVLAVVGLSVVIARHRPRLGRLVLSFGCLLLLGVVAYSTSLAAGLEIGPNQSEWNDLRALEADNRSLDGEQEEMQAYEELQRRLAGDILARRQTLIDAAKRLRATKQGQNERWLRGLRTHYLGLSDEGCVAANLLDFALRTAVPEAMTTELLSKEFRAAYGSSWASGWADAQGVEGTPLEIAQHFLAGPRAQGVPGREIDLVADEADRAVDQQ